MPEVREDSFTTLEEDRFFIRSDGGYASVQCMRCGAAVVDIDDGDDLNTLTRLSYEHARTCK